MQKINRGSKLLLSTILLLAAVFSSASFEGNTFREFERITLETFDDVKIKTTEFLYNYDGSADYVYTEFEDSGYAVYLKENMELLEYSLDGSLPYQNARAKKYYGGPKNYLNKEGEQFVNTLTGESLPVSEVVARSSAQQIREIFLDKDKHINDSEIFVDPDEDDCLDDCVHNESVAETQSEQSNISITATVSAMDRKESAISIAPMNGPGIDDNPLVNLGATLIPGATYIPNAEYFLRNPRHGDNENGTCGAVAAQLMLSYHNYYSDRRIIANQFLNGSDTTLERHLHPNFCLDPMSMTRETLGSRGKKEDGSDDANSYFTRIVKEIPASAMPGRIRRGIRNIINNRNTGLTGNINFAVNSNTGLISLNSAQITNEIDVGRPVIIGMLKSLGGWKHYVVGYGYSDHTYASGGTYSGYITHFGHSGDAASRIHIWINRAWCNTRVTLQINHEHTYDDVVRPFNEIRCTVCGHRSHSNHNYTHFTQIINQTHRAYCICGAMEFQAHTYTAPYDQITSTTHRATCSCGAKITQSHFGNSASYSKINGDDIFHTMECACGFQEQQTHKFPPVAAIFDDYQHVWMCSVCGYDKYGEHQKLKMHWNYCFHCDYPM